MNLAQRAVLLIAAAIGCLMLAVPPFHFEGPGTVHRSAGYHFILNPPELRAGVMATVHVSLLLTQMIGLAMICGTLFLATKGLPSPRIPRPPRWLGAVALIVASVVAILVFFAITGS